ncbi:MAG TPA: hypothetical protein VEK39_06205 [Solirubrobacterales bacterium]|nr:hypothetical protein [Solirubrobacterales bacterium]
MGAAVVVALLGGIVSNAEAAEAGSLDRSFGHDGRVLTDFFGRDDRARDVAIQDDGKIVAAGEIRKPPPGGGAWPHMGVVRYRRDGRLDRGFGHRGHALIPLLKDQEGESLLSWGRAVALQGNGKIVVAGNTDGIAVARFRKDGRLDRSFGRRGVIRRVVPTGSNRAEDVAIQPDGKIVVIGYTIASREEDLFLVRFLRDGSLDPSFGDGGILTTRFGAPADARGYGLAIQADAKLVVSGTVGNNWIVARFLPDGSLDPSFDGDGIKYSAPTLISEARDVALQPDGRIVTAGSGFQLGRYLPDGSLDESFGDGGAMRVQFSGGRVAGAESLALEGDGKIVAAGTVVKVRDHPVPLDPHFALARLRSDGSLDRSFGEDGTVTTGFRLHQRRRPNVHVGDYGQAIAVQRNGRIVAAGYSQSSESHADFAIARYLGTASG